MSDGQVFPEQEPTGLGLRRAEPTTAGAKLKALREASGMHIGLLSATLKVPQARLEALEADRLHELPDATFARALAKAVCRVLKVDPSDVLNLLPASTEPGLERVSKGLNQPFKAQALGGEGVSLAVLRKPVVLAPLGLLLAAAVVYLMPADFASRWRTASGPAASEPAFEPQPATVTDAASAVTLPASTAAPDAGASAPLEAGASSAVPAALTPATTTPAPAAAVSVQPAVAPAATAVEPPRVAASAAPAPAAAGLAPLALRASADSWVEVVDARGQVQYSRLMRAGEVADLQVQTPVKVRVGNVSGTRLSLRGEAVDLLTRSRDNVARLELP